MPDERFQKGLREEMALSCEYSTWVLSDEAGLT